MTCVQKLVEPSSLVFNLRDCHTSTLLYWINLFPIFVFTDGLKKFWLERIRVLQLRDVFRYLNRLSNISSNVLWWNEWAIVIKVSFIIFSNAKIPKDLYKLDAGVYWFFNTRTGMSSGLVALWVSKLLSFWFHLHRLVGEKTIRTGWYQSYNGRT